MRCRVIGSGVVRLPSPGASEVCTPSVPMLAACMAEAGPELAGEHGGRALAAGAGDRRPRSRVAARRSARRRAPGRRAARSATSAGTVGRRGEPRRRPAPPPRPAASGVGEKRPPSVRVPGSAANRSPGRTARKSGAQAADLGLAGTRSGGGGHRRALPGAMLASCRADGCDVLGWNAASRARIRSGDLGRRRAARPGSARSGR